MKAAMNLHEEFKNEINQVRSCCDESESGGSEVVDEAYQAWKAKEAKLQAEKDALLQANYEFLQDYLKNQTVVEPGHELKITEEALDRWIAAHYVFPGDHLPSSKPDKFPLVIFEHLKRFYKRKG